MKTILTYGTFDMFHYGHLRILKRAKKYGDRLIVGVSTDSFNDKKGKKTIVPFSQRKEIVENIKDVYKVIPENNWKQKTKDIKKYNVDVFIMGNDWKGKFDDLKKYCKVIYLPRTKKTSTTEMKSLFNSINEKSIKNIENSLEMLREIKRNFE
jgi:glycerol-3-phosphate cytidylyltransferase